MTERTVSRYRIRGMDCADCARTIERGVARLSGVQTCGVNFGAAQLEVIGDVGRDAVARRVHELGYAVVDDGSAASTPGRTSAWLARLPETGFLGFVRFLLSRSETACAALGAVLIVPGLFFGEILPLATGRAMESAAVDALSLAAMVAAGWPVARSAWRAVRINRTVNINGLMTLAAIGALFIGAYAEAGLVMVLFAVGEALEGFALDRARAALRSLMSAAPAEAVVLRQCVDCAEHLGRSLSDGTDAKYTGGPCPFCGWHETVLSVAAVRVGDRVLIRPGERIPVDGVVRVGSAWVDESTITGESTPATKTVGDAVFAGTTDTDGVLEVEATQLADDTVVQRIVRLVEESQARRASTERFVDRFARVYTPVVTFGALAAAIIPPLAFGAPFLGEQGWAYRALELLVVACPCALVVATPASVVSAIGAAARSGVLVKGGATIEALSRVRAVAFDKTGTLTTGRLRVVAVRGAACDHTDDASCAACDEVLAAAAAVERRSAHPAARAIVDEAERRGVAARYAAADGVESAPGRGVSGMVHGRRVVVGSPAFVGAPSNAAYSVGSVASVSVDGVHRGDVLLADSLRPEANAALQALRRTGVVNIVMLTGDSPSAAEPIARRAGVDAVHAGLLPAQKNERIDAMRSRYGAVAMVGDGINDAPALAAATVGVAMGAGAAQAMETADVTLMANDLTRLPFVRTLAQQAMRTVQASIIFAIVVKAGVMLLVLIGVGTLWMAVAADVGAALAVIFAGMRLLRVAPKPTGD